MWRRHESIQEVAVLVLGACARSTTGYCPVHERVGMGNRFALPEMPSMSSVVHDGGDVSSVEILVAVIQSLFVILAGIFGVRTMRNAFAMQDELLKKKRRPPTEDIEDGK